MQSSLNSLRQILFLRISYIFLAKVSYNTQYLILVSSKTWWCHMSSDSSSPSHLQMSTLSFLSDVESLRDLIPSWHHHLTSPHPKIIHTVKLHGINLCRKIAHGFHQWLTISGHLLSRFLKAIQKRISENKSNRKDQIFISNWNYRQSPKQFSPPKWNSSSNLKSSDTTCWNPKQQKIATIQRIVINCMNVIGIPSNREQQHTRE